MDMEKGYGPACRGRRSGTASPSRAPIARSVRPAEGHRTQGVERQVSAATRLCRRDLMSFSFSRISSGARVTDRLEIVSVSVRAGAIKEPSSGPQRIALPPLNSAQHLRDVAAATRGDPIYMVDH